jgi:hypothetical protein
LSADYAYLHKIPTEYFSAANLLNGKLSDRKILRIPYNVLNSVGWVNYPKWKVVGADPTNQLFDSPSVNVNAVGSFGAWNYGSDWNKQGDEESKWILPFASLLDVKYIIYHKDVAEQFITQTISKINYYEKNNLITKIEDNDYFNVYQINTAPLPHFYTPKISIISQRAVENLPKILNSPDWQTRSAVFLANQNIGKEGELAKISNFQFPISNQDQSSNVKNTASDSGGQILRQVQDDNLMTTPPCADEGGVMSPTLEFKKINPTKYRIRVHGASGVFPLVFSESFHDGWKAYLAKPNQDTRYKIQETNNIQYSNLKYQIV